MRRKYFLSVFFVAAVVSTNLFGQEAAFGIKGGLNLTSLDVNDPEASYDAGSGYHAGFFFREKFDKVAIQPEVMISTMNTKVTSTLLGEYQDRFTYLAIPLMVKFYPISGLNLQVGPQYSLLLAGERKGESIIGSSSTDIKDYYEAGDFSISVGAGFDFPFGLNFDARYNIGVKDINKVANGEEAKSRKNQFSLGWNFIR
jgi:hypothetical protein